jgi:DNA-binding NtrC family response regulator
LISPNILAELCLSDNGHGVVLVGSKNAGHSSAEYFWDRKFVRKDVAEGKVPVLDAVASPNRQKDGYSDVMATGKGIRAFFKASSEETASHACLVAVKEDIFEHFRGKASQMVSSDPLLKLLRGVYVGDSTNAEGIRKQILVAAVNDHRECPVLIVGESGTGKDVIARAIYQQSQRKRDGKPFIAVNCGGITSTLIGSELFGHEKGAFADAKTAKIGAWEQAGKGYLFLDEIGELQLELQAHLLTALERGIIQRVGGIGKDIDAPARVIAATNRDIFREGQQQFRRDILGRFKQGGIIILTTPLRKRPGDIPALANHIWAKIQDRYAEKERRVPLPNELLDELKTYIYPENVRDLIGALNALNRCQARQLTVNDLRMVTCQLPWMVRSRHVVLAPKGQWVESKGQAIKDLLDLTDKLNELRLSIPLFLDRDESAVSLPLALEDELTDAVGLIRSLVESRSLQLSESVAVLIDLNGRIESLVKGHLGFGAKATASWKSLLEPKLSEAENVLGQERDHIEHEAISIQKTDVIKLTNDLLALTEALARHTHEVWRRERESSGWTYGETWDGTKKTNPDLTEYEKLPDKEKDLSRKQALGTLRAIVALGYAIDRPDMGEPNQ